MKFSADREAILSPLQAVIGVVERRQTMPILANVLITGRDDQLSFTATDLEVELVARASVTLQQAGEITVPGRYRKKLPSRFLWKASGQPSNPARAGSR
jgi:DNA polymerase-3 subunit beta